MEATLSRFALEHFGQAELRDVRRTKRLVQVAGRIVAHPGGTLPEKMAEPADLKAFYRLMNCPAVTHAAVMETHRQLTLSRMRECDGVVLLIHDTTQLDYTGKHSLGKLGQIAKGFHRGYLCHNTLAVEAESGRVIGLASQILHTRPEVPKHEPRKERLRRADRESRLWTRGSEAVGAPPAGRTWVDVCDRGADAFEYLDHKHARGGWYVVRSKHDRVVWADGDPDRAVKLHGHARSLAVMGTRSIEVSADADRPARSARVSLACGRVTLPVPRPKCGEHGDEPLSAWVVHVMEIDPPAGRGPLEWVLLTNVPADCFARAKRRVDWYARRPIVEEFHKGQKTGCGIELPQFTDESRLEPAIALLSVVAVFLLSLRDAARDEQTRHGPATELVPRAYVRVVNAVRWKDPSRPTTIGEFLLAVARLGGHQNRTSDGPPGWLTLWRGWQELAAMMRGVEALEQCG
jgi:transposase-like protein